MTSSLSALLQSTCAQIRDSHSIPTLPKNRARPITPQALNHGPRGNETMIPSNGLFFKKLPAELRHKILVEAFGNRVIHMDLLFDHPPQYVVSVTNPRWLVTALPIHCGLNVKLFSYQQESRLVVDTEQPKKWRWRSSVCHRDTPEAETRPPGDRVQPAQDKCRFGGTKWVHCESWPGVWPGHCFIGIMGWLLTCRQAYVEGIHILYATNTINTASRQMFMNLSRLIVPQRLELIHSVEILWDFDPFAQRKKSRLGPLSDRKSFQEFLDLVPTAFPRLQSLYISLQGILGNCEARSDEERLSLVEEVIMAPVDNMVRKLKPQVEHVSVAIPTSLYCNYRKRAQRLGWRVEQRHQGGHIERHWRPLAGCEFRQGYWVPLGQKDVARMKLLSMGERVDTYGEQDQSD